MLFEDSYMEFSRAKLSRISSSESELAYFNATLFWALYTRLSAPRETKLKIRGERVCSETVVSLTALSVIVEVDES
jgi:hypothetical protein